MPVWCYSVIVLLLLCADYTELTTSSVVQVCSTIGTGNFVYLKCITRISVPQGFPKPLSYMS